MAAAVRGKLFGSVGLAYARSIGCAPQAGGVLLQVREYAARKGTREKARKAKVKLEVKKVGFIPHNQRDKHKDKGALISKRTDDSSKAIPTDDVWVCKYYRLKVYSFTEAIQCHRETHHPTVTDFTNAPVVAYVELNMQGPKKTRFVDKFVRTLDVPHRFEQNHEKSVLVLCKGEDNQKIATDAGATMVGGTEIIKDIMAGEISLNNYHVVVAHPNILPEVVGMRGLLKKKFPNMRDGTLNPNLMVAVRKFIDGVEYRATRDEREQDFGTVEATIGTLNMDASHLEANFAALLNDINTRKPNRPGPFITKTLLMSPPCVERLKLDFEQYLVKPKNEKDDNYEDDEQEDVQQAKELSN